MTMSVIDKMTTMIDVSQPSLWISVASISFNPIAWNIVARNEYRNKTITKMFGGNAKAGCYFLTVCIFGFGILRDSLYHQALSNQPPSSLSSLISLLPLPLQAQLKLTLFSMNITPAQLDSFQKGIAAALFLIGQLFVITSTYALGITGTFLGDYFGILMDHRVEGFPFNVLRDPMYVGSTMCFVAGAFWEGKIVAGLEISAYVWLVYVLALRYEGPFTDTIYSNRNPSEKKEL